LTEPKLMIQKTVTKLMISHEEKMCQRK